MSEVRRDNGVSDVPAGPARGRGRFPIAGAASGPVTGEGYDDPPSLPGLGDLLLIDGGPAYRVLGATATATPGVYRLDGYEIHESSGGLVVRVWPYWWCGGKVTRADPGEAGAS